MDSSTSEDDAASSVSSGKKVRFDLNDEVFEIPNKWDRLSRTRVAARRNKLVEEVYKNTKSKDSDRRGGKNKQNKLNKVKKTPRKTDTKSIGSMRTLSSPSSQVLSLDCSVLSTQKGAVSKNSTVNKKTKNNPEIKLKLSHRASLDLTSRDIVLPKISYTSDLKKAIENAVVRNRVSSELGGSLNSYKDRNRIAPQEIFTEFPKYTGNRRFSENCTSSKPLSNPPPSRCSSSEDSSYSTRKERLVSLPEYEPKFSELSRDVESWIPFSDRDKDKRKSKQSSDNQTIQPSYMVPNSILY